MKATPVSNSSVTTSSSVGVIQFSQTIAVRSVKTTFRPELIAMSMRL